MTTDRVLTPAEEFLWRLAKVMDEIATQRMADVAALRRKRQTKSRKLEILTQTVAAIVGMDVARALREMKL